MFSVVHLHDNWDEKLLHIGICLFIYKANYGLQGEVTLVDYIKS